MRVLFLHGWQSVPSGVKSTYLKDHGQEVIAPTLDDDDFDAAVRTAQAEFDRHDPDVIVGSSRGGAIAMNLNSGDTPLVLLCPAWKKYGTATTVKANTAILHSRNDDVIPFTDSEELIRNSGLAATTLMEVGNDHRLADPEPLRAMMRACEGLSSTHESILDHPAISGRYLFPQPRFVDQPFMVEVTGATLACYRRIIDPDRFTVVHFHGNGESVADYVPTMADLFAQLGLNSLFVEYRQYGGSTGQARLASMLGDGETAIQASQLAPEKAIAFGRSMGSLYAIELVHRQPAIAGLILESGIAEPSERFLKYADLSAARVTERDVVAEVERRFNHRKKLAAYKNPVLVMHTENDGLIDISHAERIHEWAGSRKKRLLRFRYGNHNTIFGVNLNEYLAAISDFVDGIRHFVP